MENTLAIVNVYISLLVVISIIVVNVQVVVGFSSFQQRGSVPEELFYQKNGKGYRMQIFLSRP